MLTMGIVARDPSHPWKNWFLEVNHGVNHLKNYRNTPSVLNYRSFDLFILSLAIRVIQTFVQNITFLLWLALSIQRFSGVAWIRGQRPEASWFVRGKEDLFFLLFLVKVLHIFLIIHPERIFYTRKILHKSCRVLVSTIFFNYLLFQWFT